MKVRANLCNKEYVVRGGEPILYFWWQLENGKRIRKRRRGFEPYMFATTEIEPDLEGFFGEQIYKITPPSGLPRDVGKIREYYPYHLEGDIKFPTRAMLDIGLQRGAYFDYFEETNRYVYSGVGEPHELEDKTLMYDIEVSVDQRFNPRPENAIWPLATIQYCDNYHINPTILIIPRQPLPENYFVHMDREDPRWTGFFEKCAPILDDLIIYPRIIECVNEDDMLQQFEREVGTIDPSRMGGWWSDRFDLPYIFGVYGRLSRRPNSLSPLGITIANMEREDFRIYGREQIDLLEWYKKINLTSGRVITSYDYKDVLKDECGIIYVDIGGNFRYYHENDIEATLEYCTLEALGMFFLNKQVGLLSHYDYIRAEVPCDSSEVIHNSRSLDVFSLMLADKPLPSKSITYEKWKDFKTFKGAVVIEPPPGVHEEVVIYDVKAMYPSIIMAYNISPETRLNSPTDDCHNLGHKMWFKRSPVGLMPRITKSLNDARDRLRRKRLDLEPESFEHARVGRQEKSIKALACSIFGTLGFKHFRLFDPYCAAAITKQGRVIIETLKRCAEVFGFRVIYGDTDSIAVIVGSIEEGKRLEKVLNYAMERESQRMKIKEPIIVQMEKYYKRILFKKKKGGGAAKKRYAGWIIWEDGYPQDKIHTMGFETRRSDSSQFTRDTMKQVFDDLLRGERLNPTKAAETIRVAFNTVKEGAFEGKQHRYGIPRGLNKDPGDYKHNDRWARGVEYSTKVLGMTYNPSFKPMAFDVKGVLGYPATDVVCILGDDELPEHVLIDWESMAEKTIKRKFEGILFSLGLDWNFVTDNLVQQELVLA